LSALTVARCAPSGHAVYPPRALCPRCHSARWTFEDAGPGTVEETVVVEHVVGGAESGTTLASVRLDLGPVVIAALDAPFEPGGTVLLESTDAGVRARPKVEVESVRRDACQ
jgi:uncharacterized OB-fold protein